MEEKISFQSDGLKILGMINTPPDYKAGERMSSGSIMEFPAETAQSMNDFGADDQVGNISPRPLLLLHSANDSVTPTYESIEMFKKAKQPAELHLLSDVDHFTFNEETARLSNIVREWLDKYFPGEYEQAGKK